MFKKFTTYQIATAIAILFHLIGLIGILVFKSELIIASTPLNLLLSFGLLLYTQQEKNKSFYLFMLVVMAVGYFVEVIGVNTGYLFGKYKYLEVLGPKLLQVPIMISVNWFIIIYCCGISLHLFLQNAIEKLAIKTGEQPVNIKVISLIIDGATIAVFFDWLMEPVAIKLRFWEWLGDGTIPIYNYVCWFVISALLLAFFNGSKFNKQNKFALHLLMIQAMFFLLLRVF